MDGVVKSVFGGVQPRGDCPQSRSEWCVEKPAQMHLQMYMWWRRAVSQRTPVLDLAERLAGAAQAGRLGLAARGHMVQSQCPQTLAQRAAAHIASLEQNGWEHWRPCLASGHPQAVWSERVAFITNSATCSEEPEHSPFTGIELRSAGKCADQSPGTGWQLTDKRVVSVNCNASLSATD